MPDVFRRTARWYANEPAFVQGDGDAEYTYGEAYEEACRFANALADAGVGRGDRVALLSRARTDHAVAYLGAQLVGGVPATVHDRESVADIVEMVRDIRPDALVFQGRFSDVAVACESEVESIHRFVVQDDWRGSPGFAESFESFVSTGSPSDPGVEVDPDDVGTINFSSGTTGRPKGVVHPHRNLVWSCHLGHYFYEAGDSDVGLFALAPSFVAWPDQVLTWISAGATVVFLEEFDESAVLDAVEREGVTSLTLVPTHWNRLLSAGLGRRDLDSLRTVGYSGAAIDEDTLSGLVDAFPDAVFTAYGSTETLNVVTKLSSAYLDEDAQGKLGRPVPGVDVRVVEPHSTDPTAELPDGEVGEIAMSGPCIAREVWENRSATESAFEDGWWFSGDLGRIGPDGGLHFEGRTDNMIVSGGINIYAERVESVLEQHEFVREAAVVGVPDDEWGERVAAVVVAAGGDVDREVLDDWYREDDRLADYQRPREYAFMETLPRTATGKVDHESLRDRLTGDR